MSSRTCCVGHVPGRAGAESKLSAGPASTVGLEAATTEAGPGAPRPAPSQAAPQTLLQTFLHNPGLKEEALSRQEVPWRIPHEVWPAGTLTKDSHNDSSKGPAALGSEEP